MRQQVHRRVPEMEVEPGSANPHGLPQQPGGYEGYWDREEQLCSFPDATCPEIFLSAHGNHKAMKMLEVFLM
ncbi:hypothetical protein E5288_WYG002154 [Bos mutus]|uniref:Uncharacterized protein n=1 Tax=Bos mutus TaxID=72004 RepID=A0A6B0S983_9CETA|nr:hypothetical protein [Bos mutus]